MDTVICVGGILFVFVLIIFFLPAEHRTQAQSAHHQRHREKGLPACLHFTGRQTQFHHAGHG